ncbi:MAG: T9SS type A sorting domain-containing protein [Cruoricaptor ignavus]|nr:T9SS type A sorting domain-containing protein [Cruoricaptor ignavus]
MKKIYILKFLVLTLFTLNAQISTNEKPISFEKTLTFKKAKTLYNFNKPDLKLILEEDEKRRGYFELPERFSIPIEVNLTTDNSGDWATIDGYNVWQLQINVPDAKAITLAYNSFWLPEGSKLFIYSLDKKHLLGAFTSMNNSKINDVSEFVTGFVKGGDIVVEYYEPQNITKRGVISVSRIGYVYKDLAIFNYETMSGFGNSLSCNINVNCLVGNNWQNEKRAISAIYNIYSGMAICSGALVNNTLNDGTPYFLTANHCLTGFDAEGNNNLWNWVFYWNYESVNCNTGNNFTPPSSQGAILRANSTHTDFALLQLNDNLDNVIGYTPYYLGWTRSTIPATSAVGIHHPRGDIKKISVDYNPISSYGQTINWVGGTTSQPNTHWKVIYDVGAVEKGSSGSPLMDQNHRVVGQLHGGGITCSPVTSYYGRFDLSWDYGSISSRRLKDWLDPIGSNLQVINGLGGESLYAISGSSAICSQGVYTIDNLPSGATVTWQVGNGLNIVSGGNGSTITVSSTDNAISSWIKATVTDGTSVITLPQKNIWVGTPRLSYDPSCSKKQNDGGEDCFNICFGSGAQFTVFSNRPLGSNEEWEWEKIQDNFRWGTSGNSVFVLPDKMGFPIGFRVRAKSDCGWTPWLFYIINVKDCNGGGSQSFQISPNPTSGILNIITKTDETTNRNSTIKTSNSGKPVLVEVYDNLGNLKIQKTLNVNESSINIQHLPTGTYILKITKENNTETHQVIKK